MLQVVSVLTLTASTILSNLGTTYVPVCVSFSTYSHACYLRCRSSFTFPCQFGSVFTLGCGQNAFPACLAGFISFTSIFRTLRARTVRATVIASDPDNPGPCLPCALPPLCAA